VDQSPDAILPSELTYSVSSWTESNFQATTNTGASTHRRELLMPHQVHENPELCHNYRPMLIDS
jgi:hypothetical protein